MRETLEHIINSSLGSSHMPESHQQSVGPPRVPPCTPHLLPAQGPIVLTHHPAPKRSSHPRRGSADGTHSPLRMAASRSLRASLMGISGICGLRGSRAGAGGEAECAGEADTAGGPGGGGGGATGGPMGPLCGGEAE